MKMKSHPLRHLILYTTTTKNEEEVEILDLNLKCKIL